MKKMFTQQEVFNILNKNPLNVKVYFEEINLPNCNDYIFFDRIIDSYIPGSNVYKHLIQIQVYSTDVDRCNKLLLYIKKNFTGTVTHSSDDEYYVATLETSLFISDW